MKPTGYSQRRRLLVNSSALPGLATTEVVRERLVPRQELAERMWWAYAEALNGDIDPSLNDLGQYPAELAELYAQVRDSLHRFAAPETRAPAVERHARRWALRERDVHSSLRLAHIEESMLSAFAGPRLQMPLVAYAPGPRDDFVRVGPQHEDPARLIELARRRVRRRKGWTLTRIAAAEALSDWRVVQSSLRSWAILDREAQR